MTIELVSDPAEAYDGAGPGLNHLVIKVESMEATVSQCAAGGIDADGVNPTEDPHDIRTRWITDPDGHRIELVQWPAGHADGMTAADWPDQGGASEGRPR